MTKKRAIIGIDLGGTKTLAVLFDEKFRAVDEIKIRTHADRDEKQFTSRFDRMLRQLAGRARREGFRVSAVGAGCAGRIHDDHGAVLVSPNVPFLKNYPIAEVIAKSIAVPVVVHNDVQAGLVGEHAFGAAKGRANALALFIGTGIGGAVILNHRLHTGSTGGAGDIGRYITDPQGPPAGSERAGVLDNAASRAAVAGEAAVLAAKNWAPSLNKRAGANVKAITSEEIALSIRNGDKPVEDLVRSRARMLGIVMANLANFLDPDIIVLGGGLIEAMPRLIPGEAEAAMRRYLAEPVARHVEVAAARLKGRSVATGAAKMAFDARGDW